MENLLIRHNALRRKPISNPFTLVELLVVVSIIAVIGAGVALTYQNLDDHAKTAMEMSDISALKKSVKHWSAVNDYKILNEMDALVDDQGNLYSQHSAAPPFSGMTTPSTSGKGITGPAGYTFEVHDAPEVVLDNLAAGGMNFVYRHLVAGSVANDSTFDAGAMGGEVDTATTKMTMVFGDSDAKIDAEEHGDEAANAAGFDYDSDGNGTPGEASDNDFEFTTSLGTAFAYNLQADYTAADALLDGVEDAMTTDKLAFIYPGGGAQMMGSDAPMNLTNEIITNAGLTPAQVEDASTNPGTGQYYLIAMGFGRFASIHKGKAIRSDAPITGKRQPVSKVDYSRYIAIFKVPTAPYNTMTGSSEGPVMVDVLSPQGYSVASLIDKFVDDKDKIQD
jgi:prepilin-type N-terminal cleavage/methylation domain-containing protein